MCGHMCRGLFKVQVLEAYSPVWCYQEVVEPKSLNTWSQGGQEGKCLFHLSYFLDTR